MADLVMWGDPLPVPTAEERAINGVKKIDAAANKADATAAFLKDLSTLTIDEQREIGYRFNILGLTNWSLGGPGHNHVPYVYFAIWDDPKVDCKPCLKPQFMSGDSPLPQFQQMSYTRNRLDNQTRLRALEPRIVDLSK
jgi:hypothetical protein